MEPADEKLSSVPHFDLDLARVCVGEPDGDFGATLFGEGAGPEPDGKDTLAALLKAWTSA